MMKGLVVFLFCLLFLSYSCDFVKKAESQKEDNSDYIQSILLNAKDKVAIIPKGIYYIDKTINIPSDISIIGTDVTFFLKRYDIHAFTIQNKTNISISGITIIGLRSGYQLENYIPKMEKNLIKIINSNNVKLSNLKLLEHTFSLLSVINSSNIEIKHSAFKGVGADLPETLPEFLYSYDGIYIVASPSSKSENIIIDNCDFVNIGEGELFKRQIRHDGDGIHFQSKDENAISNISIFNCTFNRCSARGIKAQSGKDIKIKHNSFINCLLAIGFVQETEMKNILVDFNQFDTCNIAIAINNLFSIEDVIISNNNINNVDYAIRNSGKSSFSNVQIIGNKVSNIKRCFFDGIIYKGKIEGNTINNYGTAKDKSYYMAILLAGNSSDVNISNNIVKSDVVTKTVVYLYPSVKNIEIKGNDISLPSTQFKKEYLIYSKNKSILKQIEENKIELINN